jgi:hypothetical protein
MISIHNGYRPPVKPHEATRDVRSTTTDLNSRENKTPVARANTEHAGRVFGGIMAALILLGRINRTHIRLTHHQGLHRRGHRVSGSEG